jgi:hypothetical protein
METYGGVEVYSIIINLDTKCRIVFSFTLLPFFSWRQPCYLSYRRLGGPHSRFGPNGEEKNLLPLPETYPNTLAVQPVA